VLILQCVFLMHIHSVQKTRKPAMGADEGKLSCVTMEERPKCFTPHALLTASGEHNYRSL
jgi:hypothetical protein